MLLNPTRSFPQGDRFCAEAMVDGSPGACDTGTHATT
jgi:hypothetical protein